jgi:hypothetical protein
MKRTKILILFCALMFIAGIVGSVLLLRNSDSTLVEIVQDGDVLYQLDLSKIKEKTIEIEYKGKKNTVQVKDNKIRVLDADCPDQICVKMGYLKSKNLPIVCLPNHLVIKYVDKSEDIDVMTN